ncbi:hypothetical protein NMK34_06900 [Micromonospora sp. BRA006-A]|uniref:hypothetical protein n=1 Tax=Micromonospora sp. BRA006-A TaxID=2962860 RepID=UPI00296E5228|nr:hypothetical protein [Micromonospora sp. BRA006-A]MDW3846333.1 hypothetical protein [Micromonospora sp. BRA006-A]MEE3922065.1 hypothetical protein [Micromonospora sp. BRA006-A]
MFGTRDNWRRLCGSDDMRPKGHQVRVSFANSRSHSVHVHDGPDGYLLTAVVAGADVVDQWVRLYREAWEKNRHSRLVGFRVDGEGRMVAHGWTPKDGLTAEAFQTLVRAVAREADRYEFQLTGTDRR